jgi:ABC-2 type transport system permease protein
MTSSADIPVRMQAEALPGPRLRTYGAVNARGLWTLYLKEVRRFLKVFQQTVAAPVVTTLLFFAIFTLALGRTAEMVDGISFAGFLAPGLVMMAMVQNAFANTSSSLVIGKIQGNIVDVMMPPLAPWELTVGFALGGVSRGILVGCVTAGVIALFAPVAIQHWGAVIYFAFAASLMLSLIGVVGGIWSEKFEHMAAVTNFVVTPLTFLSGTFYSIERLPVFWQYVAHVNPFFYMIDGFRYGFIGHADAPVWLGATVLAIADIALTVLAWWLFRIGYKLKS